MEGCNIHAGAHETPVAVGPRPPDGAAEVDERGEKETWPSPPVSHDWDLVNSQR